MKSKSVRQLTKGGKKRSNNISLNKMKEFVKIKQNFNNWITKNKVKSIKLIAFFLRVINEANKLQANSDRTSKEKK